ncbi:MAG TPA: metallophosphoesterase [Acidobacteriota bacterium]|nr:metallophosphoesterase [Acidobacteriota bacterium]HQM62009.1 metallophosphoesterase [Acidobacteriota bacterium]
MSFGLMLLTAGTLLQIYVFCRAATVPAIARRVPRRILAASGLILWLAFLASRTVGRTAEGAWEVIAEIFGMHFLAMLFLLAVCVLAADLATGFGWWFHRTAPALRGWALLAGTLLTGVALVQGLRPPVVHDYHVRLDGLPAALDGTVVVAVSDLHIGTLLGGDWLSARIDQVLGAKPDMIVLLGDLFEGRERPDGDPLAALRRLSAPLGVWAVAGNHESHRRADAGGRILEQAGIPLLENRWVEVTPGLVVAGVEDLTRARRNSSGADAVIKALAGRPPGAAILLSHTPWEAERAAAAGARLMLSGHTHGGQIWPFGEIVRTVYPLLAGECVVNRMTVIVSRGAGTWGPRMRLWHPGEILRITLHASNQPVSAKR